MQVQSQCDLLTCKTIMMLQVKFRSHFILIRYDCSSPHTLWTKYIESNPSFQTDLFHKKGSRNLCDVIVSQESYTLFMLREHQQKTFVMLSRFWPLQEWRGWGWVNLLKMENLWQFFFSDNAEWNTKYFWKMISADVKANKNKKK